MILQALMQYYERKADDPESGIAPPGWERKEIPFIISISHSGEPVAIEDTREFVGKKQRAKTFMVPQAVKRTVGVRANLLWDDVEYTLGICIKGNPDKTAERHAAFVKNIEDSGMSSIPEIVSLMRFLGLPYKENLLQALDASKLEELKQASYLSFRVAGQPEPIFRTSSVVAKLDRQNAIEPQNPVLCMLTGQMDELDPTHPAIKGVWGSNTSGANIVSFNASAFCSHNKKQGANSPIGKRASFAYTTALNTLLGKDSKQKITVGDATTVFWSDKRSSLEEDFGALFSEPPKDNPDALTSAVAALFQSVESGAYQRSDEQTHFCVLGLSPNAARLSVRFWCHNTVASMASNIIAYFEDLRIAHGPRDKEDLSLWRLLVSTASQDKSENIAPNLAGDTMRAILEGRPLPATLLQAALLRLKATRNVSYPRAKIIKASLNRKFRTYNPNNERHLTMALDHQNTNVGYRLGRLFALLEKIQQEANPGINATIRDKFYAAASSTPVAVFGNLMRLKNHHLAKLDNPGRRIWFERQLGEVIADIAEFPKHLTLDNQGHFAIGYYHQVQDLWTSKKDKESNNP